AVAGVDFHVDRGEVLGLVGESGCGKSVTSLSILRLIAPPGRIEAGEIVFDGRDLLALPEPEIRAIRGDRIAMIFQQPTSSRPRTSPRSTGKSTPVTARTRPWRVANEVRRPRTARSGLPADAPCAVIARAAGRGRRAARRRRG
ncbi:MAG: ATP-binding cassette domain-containing protein, partial [Chloroflexota bacterium]